MKRKVSAMSRVIIDMMIDGRIVRKINHAGRTYLPVEYGREFSIRITNNNSYRVCAVVSVDGLSVMNGEKANHDDPGYIVDAHSNMTVRGWRRGDEEVAAFEVSGKSESYAERVGKGGNTGVIGVVVYPEKRRVRERRRRRIGRSSRLYKSALSPREELTSGGIVLPDDACDFDGEPTARCMSFNAAMSTPQHAGTGYGDSLEDRVRRVDFDRDQNQKSVVALYYDTVDGLRQKGVPVDTVVGCPNPFPGEPDQLYCPAPSGDWR